MKHVASCVALVLCLATAAFVRAQSDAPATAFSRGNESASRGRWDDALTEYGRLAQAGVRSPSLRWNWAQVAYAKGLRGEALWALLSLQDLSPADNTSRREIERLRAELGLDPSEVSMGLLGEARIMARRFRFDLMSILAFVLSSLLCFENKRKATVAPTVFVMGALLALPLLVGRWREPRGVVVRKDASLVDAPLRQGVALSSLREGEAVPILGEEGDYLRIQDASGARGFAHKDDVRKIGRD